MVARNVFGWGALMACLLVPPVKAQKVLLLPGASSSVSVIAGDTFTAMAPIGASSGVFAILPNASGDRYFFVSGANVAVVDNSGNSTQSPVTVGQPISAATLTSDGKKLLVAAGSSSSGTLYVFDITSGATAQRAAITTGFNPISAAPGIEPTTAYIITDAGLSKVDLSSNTVAATLGLSGVSAPDSRVVVGPNGLVYVTAEGALYEVDPRTMTVRKSITMNAFPSKPVFSPDGRTVFLTNPGANDTNQPALMKVDLGTYAITDVKWWGVSMSSLVWAKPDRLYALSGTLRKLYQLSNNLGGLEEASLPDVGSIPTVLSIFTSTEFPDINGSLGRKYMFVLAPAALYRIDLDPPAGSTPSQITKSLPVASPSPGGIYFRPPASMNSTVITVVKYGENQSLAPAGISAPLVIRALDQTGKPAMGVPITFSLSEGQIVASMAETNSEGLAQAIIKAPDLGGTFTLTATPLTGAAAVFTLGTGTTPGEPGGGTGPGASGISITSGNGQVTHGGSFAPEPLAVVVRDSNGGPVAGAQVTFGFAAAMSGALSGANCTAGTGGSAVCTTDSTGQTQVAYLAPSVREEERSYFQTTVTATVAGLSGSANQTVTFYETAVPEQYHGTSGPLQGNRLLAPANQGATITAQAGQTVIGAFKVQVFAQSGPNAFTTIPNVGLAARGTRLYAPETPSPASCSVGFALSGPDGVATCDLFVPASTAAGTYPIFAVIAGNTSLAFTLVVEGSPAPVPVPTTATVVSGNNQSGSAGQTLSPLVAVVRDQFGATMANVPVTWTLVSGSATVTPSGTNTGADGRASAGVVLGATPGAVVVKITAGSASTTFNLTVTVAVGNLTKTSGDGQSVVVGQQFQPVSVKVTDTTGNAIAGVSVNFNVTSGAATPSTHTAVTDASGVALATFTATNNPGQIVITASGAGKSVTFNLAARLPGPLLTASSFLNAASMQPGISFGSIVAIKGDGLTTGLSIPPGACLTEASDGNIQRELPTRLAGIEVRFEHVHLAPILAICKNLDGSDQINVQVPFELAPARINIGVTTGIGTAAEMGASVSDVEVTNARPGIFEYDVSSSARAAVALRPDGTVVSPSNQARRGEVIRVFTTGLGPVLPVGDVPVKTNQPGYPGQKPFFITSVQLGVSGAPGVTAEYAQNLIGVFIVTFQVPADAQTGAAVPLVVSVVNPNNAGETATSKASSIPIAQ